MDTNEQISQEAYDLLSTLLAGLGSGFGVLGMYNIMEGYNNSDPNKQELGKRQMQIGGYLTVLSVSIKNGSLPTSEIME